MLNNIHFPVYGNSIGSFCVNNMIVDGYRQLVLECIYDNLLICGLFYLA